MVDGLLRQQWFDAAAAGDHGVDRNAISEVIQRHCCRKGDQPALAGGIGGHVRLAPARSRTDIHDRSAALRRHGEVAIGNVLGSNVFNILGAGGIISLFGPIEIAPTFTHYDHWVMAFAALLIGGFILTRARLGRLMGILMLLIYAVYIYGLVNGFDILGLFLIPPA